ncbi:hypothetical protein BMS3Abin04_02513 [bacterium BMS3Abin04]|nr:hypothetical protein BMS3Abin04_02513 [bacterium BMS3Abin04]
MKELLLVFTIIIYGNIFAQSSPVAGTWMLEKVIANGETHAVGQVMIFEKDNDLIIPGKTKTDGQFYGTWEYNKSNKAITFYSPIKRSFNGRFPILKLTAKKLVIKMNNRDFYFTKTK